MKRIKEHMKRVYWNVSTKQLEGIGVIEIILILVILIGLVLIFRNQIEAIVKSAFTAITGDASNIQNKMAVPTP